MTALIGTRDGNKKRVREREKEVGSLKVRIKYVKKEIWNNRGDEDKKVISRTLDGGTPTGRIYLNLPSNDKKRT